MFHENAHGIKIKMFDLMYAFTVDTANGELSSEIKNNLPCDINYSITRYNY